MVSLGGAAAVSSVRGDPTAGFASDDDAPLHVRVYPRPVPLWAWTRYGFDGVRDDWPPPFQDALSAIEDAFEQVLTYANERSRLEGLEAVVERGDLVRLPLPTMSRPSEAVVPSLETVLEGFRTRLDERDVLTGSTCHALLSWAPLNHRVGYGGTLSPNAWTGNVTGQPTDTGDSQTVANLGATELWDSRAVTRNMAIHEVLHTFLDTDAVEAVANSSCDHDLGTAVRVDDETMRVSPMATAYAGPDDVGGGTRFHGTGCHDHEEFHRHDGLEGVENWTYTTELSEATLEAVTRYLETSIDR
ncbi:hypothetical protein [Natronorubrum texcoconense]|uniref:hypothetical protein n=1 Tax=Natronorubrum texcoconense TaxID=1095776 RepID=UPI000B7D3804|nr:hypothetical protein [Natronorubrum texcoconense]